MSIQAFKKKGVINYGSRRSGKGPGGVWLNQGPFGAIEIIGAAGPVGFSINGSTRNVGGIGKSSAFSKNGTPYLGQFPRGSGGVGGTYPSPQPLFNSPPVRGITQGQQAAYIKPSVLSTKGMLEKKYRWINSGQYPNVWVQPVYPTGTQSDNASQWLYIQNKAAANICVNDTNKPEIYVGHIRKGGSTGCSTTPARYRSYNIMDSAGLYTKFINVAQTSSQYTLQVQRKCANPTGHLKPFPFATNGGTGNAGGSYVPPPVQQIYYNTPPAWYWNEGPKSGDTPNIEPPLV